jgi:O-antigen/teichoic acid export membrane protein
MNESEAEQRRGFLRDSAWMMMTSTVSGAFVFAPHILNRYLSAEDYGVYALMLSFLNWLSIPGLGLQAAFAQQAAGAVTPSDQRQLSGMVRRVSFGTLIVWCAAAACILFFQSGILAKFKMQSALPLWFTLLLALVGLWSQIFLGTMQGRHQFFWLGWATIVSGAGRFIFIGLLVIAFQWKSQGPMLGALLAGAFAMLIGIWQTRAVWRDPGESLPWKPWLTRLVPITIGLGAVQILSNSDVPVVRATFDDQTAAGYAAVGTLGRGLVLFTAPLVAVMFPHIARGFARSEKNNALALTVGLTALLGAFAAVALTVGNGPLFRLVYPSYVAVSKLSGLYAWSVLPIALANVLLYSLLAKNRPGAPLIAMAIAVIYCVALRFFHGTPTQVIAVVATFSGIYFLAMAFLVWREPAVTGDRSPGSIAAAVN